MSGIGGDDDYDDLITPTARGSVKRSASGSRVASASKAVTPRTSQDDLTPKTSLAAQQQREKFKTSFYEALMSEPQADFLQQNQETSICIALECASEIEGALIAKFVSSFSQSYKEQAMLILQRLRGQEGVELRHDALSKTISAHQLANMTPNDEQFLPRKLREERQRVRLEEMRQLDYNRQEAIAADKVTKLAGVKNAQDLVGADNASSSYGGYTGESEQPAKMARTLSSTARASSSPTAENDDLSIFDDVILGQDPAKGSRSLLQRQGSGSSLGDRATSSPRDKAKSGKLSALFDSSDEDDSLPDSTEKAKSPPRPKSIPVAVTLPTMLFRASTPNIVPSRPDAYSPRSSFAPDTTSPSHSHTYEDPDREEAESAAVMVSDRNIPTTGPLVWSGSVSNLSFSTSQDETVDMVIRHLDGAHGLYAHLPQHMSIIGTFSLTKIHQYVLKTTFETSSRDGKLITLSRLDVNPAENDRKKKIFHDWVQQLRVREKVLVLIDQKSVGMIYLIPSCALSISLLKPGARKEEAQSFLDSGLLCWAMHHHKSTSVLPPTLNNGVNADSGYDAEGISLIDDRDESESLKVSDDEDNEEASDARGVRFADEAVVLQEDSTQHAYAPPPPPPPPSTPSAVRAPYPEPMHPSAPSFPVTFDTQLLQLSIPCASLPIKLHPLPNSAKGSLVQLSQATELISQSLVPRGRADLSTVIAFVNKNIYPPAQDLSAKARDFAWFALRPVSGAHVPFMVELMSVMVSQNKAYVILDNADVLGYMMPTVPAVRAMLSPDATQYADDQPVDNSSSGARSLVLVIMDLRAQKPPQLQQSQYHPEQQYQMHSQPASAHGGWNGFGQAPHVHPSSRHGYMPPFGAPPAQGSVLSQWGQPRQGPPVPPFAPPPPFADAWRPPQPNQHSSSSWPAHSAPPTQGQGWGNRRY